MTAKQQFFDQVLGGLKARSAYFSRQAIQAAANNAELSLKDSSLSVYLSQAVKQCLIHDAGRGWYSRLAVPVKLDLHPCAKLVREVEKAFSLLDFTVWSPAQLNPWMHHLLAKPVHFLHAPRETLETVGEALRDKGWDVAVNPGKREAAKDIRPGEKMVVLRPLHSKHLPGDPGAITHLGQPFGGQADGIRAQHDRSSSAERRRHRWRCRPSGEATLRRGDAVR